MTTGTTRPRVPSGTPEDASLIGNRDFRRVFLAGAGSKLGSQISYLAIPLVAISALDATPGQVGILATTATVAWLLVGLPAGAWGDRMRRRWAIVLTDLIRAVLFGSIPIAWWLDRLTMHQLYVVVLLSGVCTVFFDVANHSFLPSVVKRDALVAANAKLVGLDV